MDFYSGLKWQKRGLVGSKEQDIFFKSIGDFAEKFSETAKRKNNETQKGVESLHHLLNSQEYKEINDLIESDRRRFDSNWFKAGGVDNRRVMAKEVGLEAEYSIFYSQYSMVVHGNVTSENVSIKENRILFIPIRNLEDIESLLTASMGFMIRIYISILKHYRPEELNNFARKYKEEWRPIYKNIKRVKYNIIEDID